MATATSDLNAAIAVTRFGLGTRPGEIAQAAPDPHGWLKAQICHEGADQPQTPLGAPFPDSRALSANVTQLHLYPLLCRLHSTFFVTEKTSSNCTFDGHKHTFISTSHLDHFI